MSHASLLRAPLSHALSLWFTRTPLESAKIMSPGVSRTTLNGAPPPHSSYISGDQQQASRSKTTSARLGSARLGSVIGRGRAVGMQPQFTVRAFPFCSFTLHPSTSPASS